MYLTDYTQENKANVVEQFSPFPNVTSEALLVLRRKG